TIASATPPEPRTMLEDLPAQLIKTPPTTAASRGLSAPPIADGRPCAWTPQVRVERWVRRTAGPLSPGRSARVIGPVAARLEAAQEGRRGTPDALTEQQHHHDEDAAGDEPYLLEVSQRQRVLQPHHQPGSQYTAPERADPAHDNHDHGLAGGRPM